MRRLLDRELTAEELARQASIRMALHQSGGRRATHATIREIAQQDPDLFFPAALAMLESAPDSHTCPNLRMLLDCPEFLVRLTNPDRFARDQLVERCRDFIKMDARLDIWLARLAPGRSEDKYQLTTPCLVRLLEILNEISKGPRLLLMLNHLTSHPDSRVASKAALLVGRRIQNSSWVERHFKSDDPRLRASVVEGLWGRNNAWARRTMWIALKDENNRVVGNALVGLHLLGEPRVGDLVIRMLQDSRPHFRFTAAWVMGRMGNLDFLEWLRGALADPDQRVRQAARRALVTIRRPVVRQQQMELMALAEAVQAAAPTALAHELPQDREDKTVHPEPAVEAPPPPPAEPTAEPEFTIHLDGTYIAGR